MIERDPMDITLKQVGFLRLLALATPAGLPRDGHQLSAAFSSLQALERRGLVRLLTEPTGLTRPAWRQTWLITDLGQAVLNGGVVHMKPSGNLAGPALLVFLNGLQVGEVKAVNGPPPSWRRAGWQGIDQRGVRSLIYPTKAMAAAWVAGGAR